MTCTGRIVAGDDADADITSRPRDPVHRHVLVWTVSEQHHSDRPLRRRDVHPTLRSVIATLWVRKPDSVTRSAIFGKENCCLIFLPWTRHTMCRQPQNSPESDVVAVNSSHPNHIPNTNQSIMWSHPTDMWSPNEKVWSPKWENVECNFWQTYSLTFKMTNKS